MSTSELEVQPVQGPNGANMECEMPSEDTIPVHKSSVRIDPNGPSENTGKFKHEDIVQMSSLINGIRQKVLCEVLDKRPHDSGCYMEYQLVYEETGKPYMNGKWFRESELKRERRGPGWGMPGLG